MKEITLVLFTLIFSLSLFSQNCVTDIKGDDYGLQDVNGEIIFLEVDQNNNKWFGAKNYYGGGYGIGKFDGITWTEFTALGGSDLPDDRVYDIAFDTSGNVWVATHAGLAKFDGEATNGWEIFDNTDFGSTGNEVTAIAIDSGYVKWIGLSTGEVIRYNDTTFTKFTNLNGKQINTIGIDSTHNIWFGMEATLGLSRYNHDEFTSFSQYQFIRSIQTTKNFVYASDFNGLHIFNGSEWTDIAAPGYSLYHVTLNSSNDVWLSSSIGLVEFRDSIFIPYTPMNSGIPDFLTFTRPCNFDKDDKLWFSYQYKATFTTCATGFLTENAGLGLEILSDKNFTFCEGESTELDAGEGFAQYIWSTGAITDTIVLYNSDTVHVAVSDGSGCWDYDTVSTIMQEVYEYEEICVVTVIDSQNVVVWARTADVGTEYYNVYKETGSTGVYELAGTVPFTLLSVFVDTESEVGIRSERYKIAAVDSCGNESEKSFHHKTMHLTLNVGVGGETNLIWDGYEGFDFGSYIIYRGTRVDNLVPFDTVPSTNFAWTDPEVGDYFYKIAVVLPSICSPAAFLKAGSGPYSHSFSNEESRLQAKAPPTSLVMTDTTIMDSEPAGTFVGKFLTDDTVTVGYNYALVAGEGDTDNSSFTISNDSLFSASVLEFDTQELYSIRVRTTDAEADSFKLEKVFTIKVVVQTNNAPTDISITADEVDEDLPAGTFVGKFTTTDPDGGDTHTYSLVSGDGDTDNASFTISNDSLLTAAEFDFATKATYNIRVRTTDDGEGNLTFEKQFVIHVNEVVTNAAPTDIALSCDNLDEKLPAGTIIGGFSTTDDGGTHTYSLVTGEGDDDNGSFTISNDSLVSATEFIYATQSSYSIRVRSTDEGSLYYEEAFVILVNPTGINQVGKDLRIYPIPMTDRMTVEFKYQQGQDYNLIISDLNGQRIKMVDKIRTGSIEIDASGLAPGVYILELRGPDLFRARIVKTN